MQKLTMARRWWRTGVGPPFSTDGPALRSPTRRRKFRCSAFGYWYGICGTVSSIHIKRASYKQSRKSTMQVNTATPAAGGHVIPWPLVRSFYTASGASTRTVVYCLEHMMRKVSGTRAHTRKVCLAFAGRTHIRSARVKLHCTAGKDISHLGETTSVFNPAASEIHGGTVDW